MEHCEWNIDSKGHELSPHGTPDFPCACYTTDCTSAVSDEIPWHYHMEMEVIWIEKGSLIVQTPRNTISLSDNEGVFINSNILHEIHSPDKCLFHSFVFSPDFIGGSTSSRIYAKYVVPLISECSITSCAIPLEIVMYLQSLYLLAKEDVFGYELDMRNSLSMVLVHVIESAGKKNHKETKGSKVESLRLQKMIEYIHKNYRTPMELVDIANLAKISTRECLRCFKKNLGISPMQYLLKYRIMMGADFLTTKHDTTVAEIALLSGFESPSNFTKLFRRYFQCSPKEYRDKTRVS